jgi:YHS domain-containing protein
MRNSVVFAFAVLATGLALISACDKQSAEPMAPTAGPPSKPQALAPAADAGEAAAKVATTAVKPYPLDVCIVSGEKLDSMGKPISLVYQGQEYKFCCNDCPTAFKKDPQKYVTKLQTAMAAKGTVAADEVSHAMDHATAGQEAPAAPIQPQ